MRKNDGFSPINKADGVKKKAKRRLSKRIRARAKARIRTEA